MVFWGSLNAFNIRKYLALKAFFLKPSSIIAQKKSRSARYSQTAFFVFFSHVLVTKPTIPKRDNVVPKQVFPRVLWQKVRPSKEG